MVEFLASFDAISFDRLLTFHTSFGNFGITFVTKRFITPLKKLPINFPFAATAFKALFVVDFAEGCATFMPTAFLQTPHFPTDFSTVLVARLPSLALIAGSLRSGSALIDRLYPPFLALGSAEMDRFKPGLREGAARRVPDAGDFRLVDILTLV